MSELLDLLDTLPWLPALGWALLNFVWQGALIGVLIAGALRLLAQAPARHRYLVCGLGLLWCLALPLSACLQAWVAGPGELEQALEFSSELLWMQALTELMPQVVLAWILGVGLMSLRLAGGLWWVRGLRRAAAPAPAEWQLRLELLARRLGLRRPVRLLLSEAVSGPVALGLLRPLVILPCSLLSQMPPALVEALLAHELAHVRRWDYGINLLQSLAEALLFFHPVVWWLSERMRAEREQVADALAAQALAQPRDLARALQQLSEWQPPVLPLVQAARGRHGGLLLQRVRGLLQPGERLMPAWKLALPALLLALGGLLAQAQAKVNAGSEAGTEAAVLAALPPTAASEPEPAGPAASAVAAQAVLQAASSAPSQPTAVLAAPTRPTTSGWRLPVNARHAVVIEEGSGRVLMAKDADEPVPIASLTKLVTAMVVLDARQDPQEQLRIADEDVDRLKHSASHLKVGSRLPREAALKLALLSSENRAASALARAYPGGLEAFRQAVRRKLQGLGLQRTVIQEPTGLSPENVSTASEMARIAAAASRYSEINAITSASKARVPVNGQAREFHNTNRLVGRKGWDILLSKTGYTEEAGRCLTMRMKEAGKAVTVVLLDADGSAQRLKDAAAIRRSLGR
ncbi:M56 family metallopeptidase [Pelomonas sp. BJYL3]|uniref:M56 family metallopeptidase n=1 Tax=Pelomonas sp. BJYL3 TaxID=2976697 RepID=UPI0022B5AE80|nr:M56 family metallopeptidase [Pelomonas sp. BJYL3]